MKTIRALALLSFMAMASPASAGSAVDVQNWNSISATPAQFSLTGGSYGMTLHAGTWGTATLQKLEPDNTTWVAVVPTVSADGYTNVNLPSGTYRLSLSGVSGLVGDITSIVTGP